MNTLHRNFVAVALLAAAITFTWSTPAAADQKINDDLIVCGSLCVGLDCVNGESFGFDTIRLKENNTRIRFFDTSSSASFPTNDWQLTANDSTNGGANKFSIDDIDGGRIPFTLTAGAPSHSLFVDAQGDVGLTTSTPVVELHIVDGDTPTIRLEQNGSSGFTPQTWDLAGNETNFFVRDVTMGSLLPFRIRPGAASNSLYIAANGDVGMGTSGPEESLHIRRTNGSAKFFVEEASGTELARDLMTLENNGRVDFRLTDTSADGEDWTFANTQIAGGAVIITRSGSGVNEFVLEDDGDLTITGGLTTAMNNLPDYVFDEDYELMPLGDLEAFIKKNKHLPNIPSVSDVEAAGNQVNMTEMQRLLLEKVEELTLYTVEQQRVIAALEARLDELQEDSER